MKGAMLAIVSLACGCLMAQESDAAEAKCEPGKSYVAVDLSEPITEEFAGKIKAIGVGTIIRYYDWKDETIKGKTLSDAELKIIRKLDLSIAVIFQHNSGSVYTFTKERGRRDAARSLELAGHFSQPKKSAIYFGVDGPDALVSGVLEMVGVPEKKKYLMSFVENQVGGYFGEAAPLVRGADYKIGVYGSGLVCGYLLNRKLVDYCWLAMSEKWPDFQEFAPRGNWVLRQVGEDKKCFGKEADLNVAKTSPGEFGQWKPKK